MSKQISMEKIVDAVLVGIKDAQVKYEKWSGGLWVWNAPEYILTTSIAQQISVIEGSFFLTLENGSSDAVQNAGARGKGRLSKDIREKGRVDILLWWGNDTPRGIIEVKNFIYDTKQYEKDIKRIKELLQLNSLKSTLQFGIFTYCDSADDGKIKSANQKIEDKRDKIEKNIASILGSNYKVSSKSTDIFRDDESAWSGTCILIQFKP